MGMDKGQAIFQDYIALAADQFPDIRQHMSDVFFFFSVIGTNLYGFYSANPGKLCT